MIGEVIYPLNQLRLHPEQYEFQKSKYAGREQVLDFRIPRLDVLFNDTVHCAALHPHHLFSARRALGMDPPSRPPMPSWATGLAFEIPLERILVHRVVWYSAKTTWINGAPGDDVPLTPPLEEFEPFDPKRYQPLSEPTARHIEYLRRMNTDGKRPLMFVHIPHILVAGPIDVSGLRVVSWDEPPSPSSCF